MPVVCLDLYTTAPTSPFTICFYRDLFMGWSSADRHQQLSNVSISFYDYEIFGVGFSLKDCEDKSQLLDTVAENMTSDFKKRVG
jgi:hypothetical protein